MKENYQKSELKDKKTYPVDNFTKIVHSKNTKIHDSLSLKAVHLN